MQDPDPVLESPGYLDRTTLVGLSPRDGVATPWTSALQLYSPIRIPTSSQTSNSRRATTMYRQQRGRKRRLWTIRPQLLPRRRNGTSSECNSVLRSILVTSEDEPEGIEDLVSEESRLRICVVSTRRIEFGGVVMEDSEEEMECGDVPVPVVEFVRRLWIVGL
ncbi:hypothetical protein BCR33DRAFT_504456 [Rhizoclosmatium globosum]|uniref:Uncharacterized protein n=1 Tax=Rhizoclosmatium globosum TaxID=329046 RepID=A0A1Y2BK80_9FUNG|nr:hypothetical protein BCR33DRAFT_504456 [Rhizoclosmatium globosum]|eukprot:ORY35178.1 hypothetical protein BCR33DRAFT_504456 [Rhizoclosmatium globosum]